MADLTLTLTGEAASILRRLTADGGFPTPEAALEALLSNQDEGDPALENWLRSVGAVRYDDHKANPSRTVSVAEAREKFRNS
ncbi:MAG: hypothetical protein KJS97_05760 [Alphaproteobacteria bacterium]|nr:hypothetical protein [Alphaproteobacteria bacterium]